MMKKVFGVEKFKGLLLAGSFTVLANYFVRLSDSVVAGNMLGPNALAGINLVSAILAGVSLLLRSPVDRYGDELFARDDGEIFDITDSDQEISSLRTFLVASIMESQSGRLNLVTTGFNRNVFQF